LQTSGLAGGGGVIALILASIGLYGVAALAFSQRRREIGIRTALGARSGQVVRMLFGSGLRLSVAGLLLGLPLSVMAAYFAASEVRLPDVSVVGVGLAIAAIVIGVASLATWIPARRAATVDPTIALRAE
jgi:ABC-type antimicrobial peptide transport system permease subunit